MENLSALVNSLSSGEGKLIRHFYKLRDFGEYRKRVELFNLVAEGKVKDETNAAKMMGYKSPTASYHNLKSRLKSDIVCILLMQESSSKFNTPYAQAAFSCRRALLTGEILLSRGVYQEGLNLLRKAARVAAKFELYAERIIAEDILRNHHAGSNDSEELIVGTEAIEDNYRLLGNMMRSKKKLYETVFPETSPVVSEPGSTYNAQAILSQLDDLEHESGSSRVRFYSQLSRLNIFNNTGDISNALKCAKGLLSSIEKDPVIMSKSNQAGIELEIANMYLRSCDFANAMVHAEKASVLFKKGMLNSLRALTVLFYAQVHSGMYDKAQSTLTALLSSQCLKDRGHALLNNRLLLIKSWFHFVKGEIDLAASGMKLCGELVKEKGSWFYGFALLECMIMVERRAYDSALYKLDALRKVASRSSKDAYSNRTNAIIVLLRQLIKHDNDHEVLFKNEPKELKQLRNGSAGFEWDPSGFELVRVDEWLLMRSRK